ncbi:hypothetical protein D2Q93_00840 [Alicyclobacillaceae bacterium I2511]|nr:hypothetical protein D2Q93_00840 [Alicyclobacillaceae bacterium I2511]
MRMWHSRKGIIEFIHQMYWNYQFMHTFPEVVDHLSVLTQAGISLREALHVVGQISMHRGQQSYIAALTAAVDRGDCLCNVWGHSTPGPLRIMMEAGEQTGNLVAAMSLWAKQVNNQQQWHNQILRTVSYPVLLLTILVGVLLYIGTHVLPQFEILYRQLGVSVPVSVLWFLQALHASPWVAIVCLATGSLLVRFVAETDSQNSRYCHICTRLTTPLWQFKRMARTRVLSQLLGMLILGGVPIVQSLEVLERESSETWMKFNARKIRQGILGGATLTLAFTGPWDPILLAFLRQAEGTGDLGSALMKVAEYAEQRLQVLTLRWVGWLEPSLIILLGMVVAGTMGALFIPMYSLVGQVGVSNPL